MFLCFGVPLRFLITQEMNLPSTEHIFSTQFLMRGRSGRLFYRNRSLRLLSALLAHKFKTMATSQPFFKCTADFAGLQQSHQMEPSPVFVAPSIWIPTKRSWTSWEASPFLTQKELFRINSRFSWGFLRHKGLFWCLVEQSFNSCSYEVHQDALFDKYEGVGFLFVMIHRTDRCVNYYSESKLKL